MQICAFKSLKGCIGVLLQFLEGSVTFSQSSNDTNCFNTEQSNVPSSHGTFHTWALPDIPNSLVTDEDFNLQWRIVQDLCRLCRLTEANFLTIPRRNKTAPEANIAVDGEVFFFFTSSAVCTYIIIGAFAMDCWIAWNFTSDRFTNVHRCPESPRFFFWCLTSKKSIFQFSVDHKTFEA